MRQVLYAQAARLLWRGRRPGRRAGVAAVEYAFLLALIVIATAAVWGALSQSMRDLLQQIVNSFSRYPSSGTCRSKRWPMDNQVRIIAAYSVLGALLAVCTYTDARFGKVRNVATMPALALGLAINGLFGGWAGLASSAQGIALALGLFLVVSILGRVMGAGDAKLLMAVGALVGPVVLIWAVVYGALAGGAIALILALAKGRLKREVVGLVMSLAGRLTGTAKLDYSQSDSLRIPYAIPLAVGAVMAIVLRGGVMPT